MSKNIIRINTNNIQIIEKQSTSHIPNRPIKKKISNHNNINDLEIDLKKATEELLMYICEPHTKLIENPTHFQIESFNNPKISQGIIFLEPSSIFKKYIHILNTILNKIDLRRQDTNNQFTSDALSILRNDEFNYIENGVLTEIEAKFIEQFEKAFFHHLAIPVNHLFNEKAQLILSNFDEQNGVIAIDSKTFKDRPPHWHEDIGSNVSVVFVLREHSPTLYIPLQDKEKAISDDLLHRNPFQEVDYATSTEKGKIAIFCCEKAEKIHTSYSNYSLIHTTPRIFDSKTRYIVAADLKIK